MKWINEHYVIVGITMAVLAVVLFVIGMILTFKTIKETEKRFKDFETDSDPETACKFLEWSAEESWIWDGKGWNKFDSVGVRIAHKETTLSLYKEFRNEHP